MIILQTTLCLAAAAAVINLWLSMRIGQLRHAMKIDIGDGGNEAMIRRMRAQANFIENTPLFLVLVGLIEAAGKGGVWLAPVGALFMLGRVAHGIGMDGKHGWARMVGALTATLISPALAVVAVLVALGRM